MDKLDSEPERASRQLAEYLYLCLRSWYFSGLDEHEKEEMGAELWNFYRKNGFAQLRKYEDQGHAMSVWCWWKANQLAKEKLERKKKRQSIFVDTDFGAEKDENDRPTPQPIDPHPDASTKHEYEVLQAMYAECLEELKEHERRWIEMDADELRPREIVALLGMDPEDNAKVSNGIGYARTVLNRCLERKLKPLGLRLQDFGQRAKRRRVERRGDDGLQTADG